MIRQRWVTKSDLPHGDKQQQLQDRHRCPFNLADDAEGYDFQTLERRAKVIPIKFLDVEVLAGTAMKDEMVELLDRTGLLKFSTTKFPSFQTLCYEFFTTFSVIRGKENTFTCRLDKRVVEVTPDIMSAIFGFPSNPAPVAIEGEAASASWKVLTGNENVVFSSQQTSCTLIENPCYRLLHKFVCQAIFGKFETSKVSLQELTLLSMYKKGVQVSPVSCIVNTLASISKGRKKYINMGHIVTGIAAHFGMLDAMPDESSRIPNDVYTLRYLRSSGIVECDNKSLVLAKRKRLNIDGRVSRHKVTIDINVEDRDKVQNSVERLAGVENENVEVALQSVQQSEACSFREPAEVVVKVEAAGCEVATPCGEPAASKANTPCGAAAASEAATDSGAAVATPSRAAARSEAATTSGSVDQVVSVTTLQLESRDDSFVDGGDGKLGQTCDATGVRTELVPKIGLLAAVSEGIGGTDQSGPSMLKEEDNVHATGIAESPRPTSVSDLIGVLEIDRQILLTAECNGAAAFVAAKRNSGANKDSSMDGISDGHVTHQNVVNDRRTLDDSGENDNVHATGIADSPRPANMSDLIGILEIGGQILMTADCNDTAAYGSILNASIAAKRNSGANKDSSMDGTSDDHVTDQNVANDSRTFDGSGEDDNGAERTGFGRFFSGSESEMRLHEEIVELRRYLVDQLDKMEERIIRVINRSRSF